MADLAEIAVVGGSGFYEFGEDAEEVAVDTPFGAPSDPITVGEVAGRPVAFLPRHGRDHRFPPHKIPYPANLWALRSTGVRPLLAPPPTASTRVRASPRPKSSTSSPPISSACATWSPRSSPPSPPTAKMTSAPTPWTASPSPSPSRSA